MIYIGIAAFACFIISDLVMMYVMSKPENGKTEASDE